MTVRVVYDGPRVPFRRRLGRLTASLLGALILMLAFLAMTGTMVPVILVLDQGAAETDWGELAPIVGICAAVALVSVPIAIRLLRGRRRLVLFLRRFRFDDAAGAVTFAALEVVGRSWRIVTLDDDRVEAVGGPRGHRRLLALIAVVLLAAVGFAVWWYVTGGPDRLFEDVVNDAEVSDSADGVIDSFFASLLKSLVGGIVAAIVLAFIISAAVLGGVTSLFAVWSYARAVGSERAKSGRIRTERDVSSRSDKIDKRSSQVFAPRLVVVRVADPVWRQAVHAFAARADAVIVDVSVASENLMWEIRTLLPMLGSRCVLIGRSDLLTQRIADGRTIFNPALGGALDGRTVLAYQTSKREMRRFGRGLRGFLESTGTRRSPRLGHAA